MDGYSLAVILIAMAVGLVAGFEVGRYQMRKQFQNVIESYIQYFEQEAKKKQAEREEARKALAESVNSLMEKASKLQKTIDKAKEKKEDGIQLKWDFENDPEWNQTPGEMGESKQ